MHAGHREHVVCLGQVVPQVRQPRASGVKRIQAQTGVGCSLARVTGKEGPVLVHPGTLHSSPEVFQGLTMCPTLSSILLSFLPLNTFGHRP